LAEMTAEEAIEWGKTLDFPTVWATITRMSEKVDRAAETVDKLGERIDRVTANINKMGERVDRVTANIDGLNKMAEKVDRVSSDVGGLHNSMGAIVGAVVKPEIREYAEQCGFFVLELTGEDIRLLEPSEGFVPKEW